MQIDEWAGDLILEPGAGELKYNYRFAILVKNDNAGTTLAKIPGEMKVNGKRECIPKYIEPSERVQVYKTTDPMKKIP